MTYRRDPRRDLLERADRAEQVAAELPERGARLLTMAAVHLRDAARIYESDPTLVDDPAGRERDLDLIAELGRQIVPLVRDAVLRPENPHWSIAARWEEAEALSGRFPVVIERARTVARPDHASPAVSQEISQMRLAAASDRLYDIGEQLHATLARAMELPHPSPQAFEIAVLADQILAHAEALQPPATD